MKIEDFELERWFAQYEHTADIMLAESGIRSLDSEMFDLNLGKLGYVIPTNGNPTLRKKIGKRYKRSKDEVLFTCGTQEANFLVFISILEKGDHAITVTPTYQALHSIPRSFCELSKVWLKPPDWKLDIEKIEEAITKDTKLIILNNPNNPTGKYHPKEKVKALLEIAEDNDTYLLCDEVYRLLADDPLPPVASMNDRGISTTSLTKSYGLAGTRFGWIAGPKNIIDSCWKWKDYTTISPSILGQHIAKQVFEEMEKKILDENRKLAKNNKKIVQDFLDKNGLRWYDPVGVNGFVTIPDSFDSSVDFCKRVVEETSVVLAPGKLFGYDEYFRIGFGLPTDGLKEGLNRLDDFIQENKA
ncbi:MAG: aminotransferase class I/II-fold pyridoxal phosphate-dependent enzyme [Thermoplasmatota archaeon]